MSDPLYSKELLRLATDAHGAGRLDNPDGTGEAFNKACGDHTVVDIARDESGRVRAFAQTTKACVLAQASASILGLSAKGAALEDIEKLANDIATMLVTDGAPPNTPFADYSAFKGATEHRNRHRCVLLPVNALLDAFYKSENV